MRILKVLIFFVLVFCLQGFLFNGLIFDVLPIMPMWLRLLPFHLAKALFTTTEGLLYPEVTDFTAVVFFNFVNTLLICFVFYALWSLRNKFTSNSHPLSQTNLVPQNKSYLLLGLLTFLVLIQLFLFYFWPTLWFEHPNWLISIAGSFSAPLNGVIGFLSNFLASVFNALVFLLASYGFYRFVQSLYHLYLLDTPLLNLLQV